MAHYWLCPSCASLEEHAIGRAAYHTDRADDLRGVGRHEATQAAEQADHWAAALVLEWTA